MNKIKKRIIFFDLDGTLHKQDMFSLFMIYMIKLHPINLLLVLLLLPVIVICLLLLGRCSILPINILLWSITFGYSRKQLLQDEKKFVYWFKKNVTIFPIIQKRLLEHITEDKSEVWLITGSPRSLVEKVYSDSEFLPQVKLIGSEIKRFLNGNILSMRCFGNEKVVQLQKRIGIPLNLDSGYSDSKYDNNLLFYCNNRWRVTANGKLNKLY